jgi:hypothetical protein
VGVTITSLVNDTSAKADTLQMSSDNSGTGWYPNEPLLAPSAVTGGDFGELFDTTLTGQVYAQPLISQPTVLAVTEDDDVYGLNSTSGTISWQRNFGPQADPLQQTGCGDIGSAMGITGTPVIDSATDTAYFVAATSDGTGGATEWFMDAVNVQTGATPADWPAAGVPIQGSADGDPGTVFNGQWETQRPGLVLVNGVVYATFGSQCDNGNWEGWVIGVAESSHTITTMWSSETGVVDPLTGQPGGGIWQSGAAPVVDSQGNIYVATGNGDIPSSPESGTDTSVHNFGEAVVELSTASGKLQPVDFFIPSDAPYLNSIDGDLGSGGLVALPASMGTPEEPNVLLEVGKEGIIYALNMNALGGYQHGPGGSDAVPSETGPGGGVWSKPTVWPGDGGYVYIPTAGTLGFQSNGGSLNVFQRTVSASGAVYLQPVGATANSGNTFGFGSGKPIVTSNGTVSGSSLLWIIHDNDGSGTGAELEAYNPIPENPGPDGTLQEVWNSPTFTSTKFSEPGVDNGTIYVGTKDDTLLGFGLLPSSTPSLTGDNVDFTPTTVSQSVTATATFTATTSTTVSSFTPAGSAFTIGEPDQTLPASLTAGQSITVPVTFMPNAIGANPGTLTANATVGAATVTLSGDGLSATEPISTSEPQSVTPGVADFGDQPIGGSKQSQHVTFTNVSATAVTITGFNVPVLPFAVTGAPTGGTLGAGDSITVTVSFTPPGSSGDFEHVFGGVATLDTSVGDFGVPVSGAADPPAQINIVPTTLNFGNVTVGSSETLPFDLGNQGAMPLTITLSTPPATNGFAALTNPFTQLAGSSDQLAPNTSIQESVSFTPTSTGPVTGTWLLEGNDGSGVQTVTMTGTGVSVPDAPNVGTATAGDSSATMRWSAPSSDGGSAIISYKVTAVDSTMSSHGGQTCATTGATSCVVNGLTNGDDYTFSVTATNTVGTGAASSASNSITPFVPAPPPSPPPSSGSGTPPAVAQSALTFTTLSGHVGRSLTLATSGGSGSGSVTFAAVNGTATGCKITGSALSVTTAGTCIVTATKAGDATYLAISSSATTINFEPKVPTALPTVVTVTFAAKSSALSTKAKEALDALGKKLASGASVTVTGYAKGNNVLAKSRAAAVTNYLSSLIKVHVTLKSVVTVVNVALNKATVATTKQ